MTTDITGPFDVRALAQDDFEDIKAILPDVASFIGVRSPRNAILLDLGNYVEWVELVKKVKSVVASFEEAGVPVTEVGIQPDYRGATNQALFMVVTVANDEAWEPSGYGGISIEYGDES